MKNHEQEMIQDLTLLYELAVKSGQSLDLQENVELFLRTLLSRKQLSSASVWFRLSYLYDPEGTKDGEEFKLLRLIPSSLQNGDNLPANNSFLNALGRRPVSTVNQPRPFKEGNCEFLPGTYGICKLGDVGFILLHSSELDDPRLQLTQLAKLQTVFPKFRHALDGCIAYRLVKEEIQQRAVAEARLREREQMLFSIFDKAPTGIILVAPDGKIMNVNQRFAQILGFQVTEIIGTTYESLLDNREVSEYRGALKQVQAGENGYSGPRCFRSSSGEPTWIRVTTAPVRNDKQELLYVIVQGEDQTELRNAQSQLMQSAKLAGIGEVSAGIAHEIKTPLATISTTVQNLKIASQLKKEFDPKKLDQITKMVEKCLAIVNHMRGFARVSDHEEWELADVNLILQDAFLLLRKTFYQHDIQIAEELAKDLPKLRCNTIQIEQVFTNLLNNARDAMEGKAGERQLTVRTYEQDKQIAVEFEDTGLGMTAEVRERIFDSFYTTKPKGKGTGLGMSIIRAILEDHHGHIEVRSEVGKGTCFKLLFPVF
jgi:PAS domain S-box-containing protein